MSKRKPYWPAAGPTVEPVLQLADDVGEIGDGSLLRLQHVNPLDGIPQLAFLFEVEPVSLLVALDEHAEEAEEKLQVLFGRRKGERIDGEVARLLADVEVRAAEDRGQRLEAAADVEDEGQRLVLLGILQEEVAEIDFCLSRSSRG